MCGVNMVATELWLILGRTKLIPCSMDYLSKYIIQTRRNWFCYKYRKTYLWNHTQKTHMGRGTVLFLEQLKTGGGLFFKSFTTTDHIQKANDQSINQSIKFLMRLEYEAVYHTKHVSVIVAGLVPQKSPSLCVQIHPVRQICIIKIALRKTGSKTAAEVSHEMPADDHERLLVRPSHKPWGPGQSWNNQQRDHDPESPAPKSWTHDPNGWLQAAQAAHVWWTLLWKAELRPTTQEIQGLCEVQHQTLWHPSQATRASYYGQARLAHPTYPGSRQVWREKPNWCSWSTSKKKGINHWP